MSFARQIYNERQYQNRYWRGEGFGYLEVFCEIYGEVARGGCNGR